MLYFSTLSLDVLSMHLDISFSVCIKLVLALIVSCCLLKKICPEIGIFASAVEGEVAGRNQVC